MVDKICEYTNENSAEYGQWKLDDSFLELLQKKKKKMKRLRKKLKKSTKKNGGISKKREKAKKKIKTLKRKIHKLKKEKRKNEMNSEMQLMRNQNRYDMLRMMLMLQIPKGRERLIEEASKCAAGLLTKEEDGDGRDIYC